MHSSQHSHTHHSRSYERSTLRDRYYLPYHVHAHAFISSTTHLFVHLSLESIVLKFVHTHACPTTRSSILSKHPSIHPSNKLYIKQLLSAISISIRPLTTFMQYSSYHYFTDFSFLFSFLFVFSCYILYRPHLPNYNSYSKLFFHFRIIYKSILRIVSRFLLSLRLICLVFKFSKHRIRCHTQFVQIYKSCLFNFPPFRIIVIQRTNLLHFSCFFWYQTEYFHCCQ